MKICTRCNTEREMCLFSKSSKNKDGLHAWCKLCFKEYERVRYQNGDSVRKKRNTAKAQEKARAYIWNYLCKNPCIGCGEADARVLEFDHRDDTIKNHNVSEMQYFSTARIQEEIDKCDIRCANCHKLRTIEQFGFWRGDRVQ